MDLPFILDYEGPASFYKLLAARNQSNPIFLSRLLKPKKYKKSSCPSSVDITIKSSLVHHTGKLITAMVEITSLPNKSIETEIKEGCVQSYDINKGSQFEKGLTFNIDKLILDYPNRYVVLVVIYQPTVASGNMSRSPTNSLSKASILETVENVLSSFSSTKSTNNSNKPLLSSASSSTSNMCVIDLFPSQVTKSSSTVMNQPHQHIKTHQHKNVQSQFWPSSLQPQLVSLSPKLWPSLPAQARDIDERDFYMEVSVRWVHDRIPVPMPTCIETRASPYLNYHYLYLDNKTDAVKSVVEKKNGICCPWCPFIVTSSTSASNGDEEHHIHRSSLPSLLRHLENSHFHFIYEPVVDLEGQVHIIVHRDRSHDCDTNTILREIYRPFAFLHGSRRKDMFRISIPKLLDAETSSHIDMIESNMMKSLSSQRSNDGHMRGASRGHNKGDGLAMQGPLRQYYHARLGLPVQSNETFYDSDHDVDTSYDLIASNRALDEFEDVSFEEKEFMKIWNTYMHSTIAYSDSYLPMECEKFAEKFGAMIVSKNLRHNFALHLFNMWDFGLLRGDDIQRYLSIVDKVHASK